jgi:hypothetical protein
MATPYKCSRCGLANPMGSTHCQACGMSLSTSTKPFPPSSPPPKTVGYSGTAGPIATPVRSVPVPVSVSGWFGWKKIEGQVIHVEPAYMARPDFNWGGFFIKLLIAGFSLLIFGPIALGFIIFFFVLSLLLSILFPMNTSRGPGFLSSVASQVVGFFLTSKLLGPKADIPVRDIRLRDKTGQEHLIRLKGDLISGNINVGDEIEVEGYDRRGTLMLKRGLNKRTRSEIRVKRR